MLNGFANSRNAFGFNDWFDHALKVINVVISTIWRIDDDMTRYVDLRVGLGILAQLTLQGSVTHSIN